MRHFRDGDEECSNDDGPMIGLSSERREEKLRKQKRAEEIIDGTVLGIGENDEEVLEKVREEKE